MCEKKHTIKNTEYNGEELEMFLRENPLQNTIEKICKDITEQKDNAMAIEFTKVICELLGESGVYVCCTETNFGETITENSIEEKYGICFDEVDFSEHDKKFTDEIKELKSQLERKQTEINQIDEILNELFGVTHDIAKPAEFERILKEKAEGYKTISDFLPTEPIKVADILINECHTTDCMGFDVSELRQIAEHLLVYCNANGKGEE